MKSAVSLFVEIKRMPKSYQVFHYIGDRNPDNWFRMPLEFSEAVKVCEQAGFQPVKNLTVEEIVINHFEKFIFVFFDSEHTFLSSHSLTSD